MVDTLKRRKAIDAGAKVFMRHGFAQTTMGLIAESAGMSRPALYLLFNNKEEILKAVIDTWTEESLEKMSAAIADIPSVGEKLRIICAMWSVESFERSQNNPEVRDLAGNPAYADGYARFIVFVAEILSAAANPKAGGIAIADLARLLVIGIRGFKTAAASREDLLHLIDIQISLVEDHLSCARAT